LFGIDSIRAPLTIVTGLSVGAVSKMPVVAVPVMVLDTVNPHLERRLLAAALPLVLKQSRNRNPKRIYLQAVVRYLSNTVTLYVL
jgi:hypothetical protein